MDGSAWNGITSAMMLEVFSEVKSLLPIVAPAVIGFLGFRKAWAFLRGAIAGLNIRHNVLDCVAQAKAFISY